MAIASLRKSDKDINLPYAMYNKLMCLLQIHSIENYTKTIDAGNGEQVAQILRSLKTNENN